MAPQTLAPSGFIFHMSRCGSTLVSQMLASLPYTVVISEPPPLDQLLQGDASISSPSFDEQVKSLRRLVLALGQRRTGSETHYFLKLDCWHIHRLPLFGAAFPQTPCLFLFRDPLEVMRSHAINPGMQVLPGALQDPRLLGLTFQDITRLSRDEWCAHVLAHLCEAALAQRGDPRMLFVDYRDLPDAVAGPIARHFSLAPSQTDAERMRSRALCDAKTGLPRAPAERDPAAESRNPPLLNDSCAAWLEGLYADLRSIARLQPAACQEPVHFCV